MNQSITQDNEVSSIPNEVRREIWRRARQPEVQQKPVVYLLLETTLGWKCGVPGLPEQTPAQPSESGLYVFFRCPESLFRVMRKMGLFPAEKPKKTYKPKPYEQMTHPGERVQVDVKVVPRKCITDPELRLFQYTAIDEFTRLRFLAAYPEQFTYSSADFLRRHTSGICPDGQRL